MGLGNKMIYSCFTTKYFPAIRHVIQSKIELCVFVKKPVSLFGKDILIFGQNAMLTHRPMFTSYHAPEVAQHWLEYRLSTGRDPPNPVAFMWGPYESINCIWKQWFDGLVQDCSNSVAYALELL